MHTPPSPKVPPHNLEAERSVLGASMIEKNAVAKVIDLIEPRDFYLDAHCLIFSAIVELFRDKSPVDLITVSAKLASKGKLDEIGGQSYLSGLVDEVITASHIFHHASIVQEKASLRKLISAGAKILELGYAESADLADLTSAARDEIFKLSKTKESKGTSSVVVSEFLEDYKKNLELRREHKAGIFFGRDQLDKVVGMERSQLVTIAARPGVGKSALAMNLAFEAINFGFNVVYSSLEMSEIELTNRLLSRITKVHGTKFKYGNVSTQEVDYAFRQIQEAKGRLTLQTAFGASIEDILMNAELAEESLDILILDHIDLVQHKNFGKESEATVIGRMTSALKAFAGKKNCLVICLSQFNRESKGGFPELHQLRGSGAKEQDSDTVLILHRNTSEPDALEFVEATLRVSKNRSGLQADIRLKFTPETTYFEEM